MTSIKEDPWHLKAHNHHKCELSNKLPHRPRGNRPCAAGLQFGQHPCVRGCWRSTGHWLCLGSMLSSSRSLSRTGMCLFKSLGDEILSGGMADRRQQILCSSQRDLGQRLLNPSWKKCTSCLKSELETRICGPVGQGLNSIEGNWIPNGSTFRTHYGSFSPRRPPQMWL